MCCALIFLIWQSVTLAMQMRDLFCFSIASFACF
jgi:hypothetical protein